MPSDNLSEQYQQQVEHADREVFQSVAPVQLEATIPPKPVTPDVPGVSVDAAFTAPENIRTDAELASMGASMPTPSPALQKATEVSPPDVTVAPRKEFTVETPEVQAIRQQFHEEMAKIGTGEMALEAVGQAGRQVADAIAPGIEVAGRAIGLDEEGAAALSKGFVEFIAGLPGQSESDLTAGVETALAALPMVGAVVKGGKIAGKALGPVIAKEFEKAATLFKSERGSVPVGTGGAGVPPILPPTGGPPMPGQPSMGGEISRLLRTARKPRDPKIDEAFAQAQTDAKGFVDAVGVQRRGVLHDPGLIALSKKSDLTLETILGLPPGSTLPPEELNKVRTILKSSFKAMKKSGKDALAENTPEAYQQAFADLGETRDILTKLLGLYAEPSRSVRIMNRRLPQKGPTSKAVATTDAQGLSVVPPDPFADMKGDRPFRIADPWINKLYDFFANLDKAAVEQAAMRERTMQETGTAQLAHTPAMEGQAPPLQLTQQAMREFLGAITDLPDEEQLLQFIKSMERPIFWDAWQENWYNAMLVGLAPVKNLIGSPVILTAEILNRGVAAGVDAIGTGMVRWVAGIDMPRSVYFGESAAMVHGVVESFGDGLRAAWQGITRNRPITPGTSLAPEEAMPNDPGAYLDALNQQLPKVSSTTAYLNLTGLPGRAVDYLATAGPRMLVGGDEFNKALAYRAELRALALRKGYQAVAEEGLTGAEAATRIQDIKREVLTNSGNYPEVIAQAQKFAQYVTLQEELGSAGDAFSHFANTFTLGERSDGGLSGFPIGKILAPFTKITTNSSKMAGEWTGPLSLLSNAVRTEIAAGGSRAAVQMGKVAFSTMYIGMLYELASNGLITGTGPRNKDAKKQWMEVDGKIPLAIWDPFAKSYRSTSGLEPFNSVMGAVADFEAIFSTVEPGTPAYDQAIIALEGFTLAVANNIGSKSYLQGVVGMGNAALSGDITSWDEFAKKTLPNLTIPYLGALRQVKQGMDPSMRQAMDAIDHLIKDIPGLSETLPEETNALGRVMVRNGGWWNPFYHGPTSEDPELWKVLNEHGVVLGMPDHSIDGVPLTAWQYHAYKKLATDGLADTLTDQLVDYPGEKTDAEVESIVNRETARLREQAKAEMRKSEKYPELADKLQQQADKKREGERVKPNPFTPGRLAPTLGP